MIEEVNEQINTENVEKEAITESDASTLIYENNEKDVDDVKKEEDSEVEEKIESEKDIAEYTDFTIPEGFEFDSEVLSSFKDLAKETNLNQSTAQKYIDLYTNFEQKKVEAQEAENKNIREGWVSEIKSDKEFGGINFNQTITRAQRVLSKFGDKDLTEILNRTGLGDNPQVIKLFARIDKQMGEDTSAATKAAERPKTAAELFYK